MSTESELQAQYNAAVKRWEAAKKERGEKEKLVDQQPNGSREYHLVMAEFWKEKISFVEKYEKEYAAECKKCEIAVNLMIHCHGVDSKAAQIAKHRLELARTKEIIRDSSSLYCIEWYKLECKCWQLYHQLKGEGCHVAADELHRAIWEFCNRITDKSNGVAFNKAWDAANAALDKWEKKYDRTNWDLAKPKYDAELEKWNAFKPKGDEYAKALESEIKRVNTTVESELQTRYDAAVKDWEAAVKAKEAADKERDERLNVITQQQKRYGRGYNLVMADYWKADIIWTEKYEQLLAAEREKREIAVYLMVHQHSVESKASQIARHRLQLSRTKGVSLYGVHYLTKWSRLRCKGWLLYWQLKAAECDAAADEIDTSINEFCNRISDESNGKVFNEAWNVAEAALNKWENKDDSTDWDAAKPKYDAELETWNAFKPKGDEYAKELEKKFYEYIVLECIRDFATEFFPNELAYARIQKLESYIKRNNNETCEGRNEIQWLNDYVDQTGHEICELKNEIQWLEDYVDQKGHEICELKNDLQQKDKEIQGLRDDIEEKRRRIRRLEEGGEKKCEEIWGLKGEIRKYVNEMYEMNKDLELKRRRIRRLEDGGEEKCEEIKRLKDEMKHNVKEMYEMKGTIVAMVECIKSLTQGFQTLMRGQCQYIAESEATARTAVEREWQLWCEHTMAERRTLQESEAAARHQQL